MTSWVSSTYCCIQLHVVDLKTCHRHKALGAWLGARGRGSRVSWVRFCVLGELPGGAGNLKEMIYGQGSLPIHWSDSSSVCLNLGPVILSNNEHYPLTEEKKKKKERRQCCTSLSVASCSRACLCKSYMWRRTTIFICNASKLLHISRTKLIHNIHLHKNTMLFSASCVGGLSTSPTL